MSCLQYLTREVAFERTMGGLLDFKDNFETWLEPQLDVFPTVCVCNLQYENMEDINVGTVWHQVHEVI